MLCRCESSFQPVLSLILTILLCALTGAPPRAGDAALLQDRNLSDTVEHDTTLAGSDIQTLPGFEAQIVYEVPLDEQGSWVALGKLPGGDLIASDQGGEGLFRISIGGSVDEPVAEVEKIMMPLSGAQGLEWAFGRLYVNVNGRGLFEMWDSGTGEFDMAKYAVLSPAGEGEHGNHAVVETPNGENLFVLYGNHSPLPDSFTSRVKSWDEDILLPRTWDARGHARGILAPGGFVAVVSPEATDFEIYTTGFRNAYDMAVNGDGELFVYDADMEWDMGMPWYRPTRIVHAVSGADWGWRSGSGKWKEFYEDSLPPMYNIGPGSPTGLMFGTGAAFPARYQRALFALDWTFGTMRAVHLTPDGSSYTAEGEEFLSGSPLPLTDAVVGDDGHLYFVTGGRGGESRLWRVVYTGGESTAPAEPTTNPEADEARALRRRLEEFHGRADPLALEAAWPHLSSEDRFIRHAARAAVEWQPVNTWSERALTEERPQARITALTALARTAPADYRDEAIESLLEMDVAGLTANEMLGYLRAMSLVLQRLGDPTNPHRAEISDKLLALLPNDDDRVNVELVRNLVYLRDERVIDKALALILRDTKPPVPDWDESLLERSEDYGGTILEMLENPPPVNKLEYAFMLRNLRHGWTIDQRRQYFAFINEAADRAGGESYTGFLERMREEALTNASEEEIEAVADLTGVSLARKPDFEIVAPQGPGREWTLDAAEEAVDDKLENQNFERGRGLFHAIACASCHRFAGYGGNIGPDLSSVGNRFAKEQILEEIIHPSRVISDQYSSSKVTTDRGETHVGRIVERRDSVEIYPQDPDAPPTVVPRGDVVAVTQVSTSQMPAGLINPLSAEELRDLMAYMLSGGDPEHEVYVSGSEDDETQALQR